VVIQVVQHLEIKGLVPDSTTVTCYEGIRWPQ